MSHFEAIGRHETAATLAGVTTRHGAGLDAAMLSELIERLRASIGDTRYEELATRGAIMDVADAAQYARQELRWLRP